MDRAEKILNELFPGWTAGAIRYTPDGNIVLDMMRRLQHETRIETLKHCNAERPSKSSLYDQILDGTEKELDRMEDITSRITGNKEDIKTIEDYMFKLEDRVERLERAVVKLISLDTWKIVDGKEAQW